MADELQRAAREVPRAAEVQAALPGRLEDVAARQGEAQQRLQEIAGQTMPPVEHVPFEQAAPPPAAVAAAPAAAVDPRLYDEELIAQVRKGVKSFSEQEKALTAHVRQMEGAVKKATPQGKVFRAPAGRVADDLAPAQAKLQQLRDAINEGNDFLARAARAPKRQPLVQAAAPAAEAAAPAVKGAIAGPAVPPLHEQLQGVNTRAATAAAQAQAEAARAAQAVPAGAARRRQIGKRLAGYDERAAAGEAGAAAVEPHFLESVTERMQPFREREAQVLGEHEGRVSAAAGRQAHFQQQLEGLPEGMRGDLDAIEPLLNGAKKTEAVATADLHSAAEDVKTAGKRLTAAGKLPTAPNASGKFDAYEAVHAELVGAANNPNLSTLTKDQLNRYGAGVAKLARIDADEAQMGRFFRDLTSGKVESQIETIARDGFELLRTNDLLGSDKWITSEMAAARSHWQAAIRQEPGGFGKAIDAYTKFFKNWATATPGFHVRNGLSATFMNMSDGVSFRNMRDGVTIWKAFRKAPEGDWVTTLPERLQGNAQRVVDAVYGSGAGGRYSAAELGERAFGGTASKLEKLSKNKWTTKSQAIGERVEGSVRAGMALDSLLSGEGINSAVQRIKRIHFDYSDVNEFDQAIRRVIPFWTFMSRNLPLQVQQMWLKPRTYNQYASLVRNFDADPTDTQWMPDWMKAEGAFMVGNGVGLAPDIGSTQINEQVQMLADPKRLLSSVNPLFKVPAELVTNQDFFYGNQYKKNDFQKMGWDTRAFAPLLQALGVAQSTPSGPVMERKNMNALYDLIPFLAQANRLGSTTSNREGKGWQTAANYIGVPLRLPDPQGREKEVLRLRQQSRYQTPDQARLEALKQFQ
jgi:hypothetical protein